MTDFSIPLLGATISPWMLALIGAIIVAGLVLLLLGMRRGRTSDGAVVESADDVAVDDAEPREVSGAEALGLEETGEDTDLDQILTDQTYVDGNAPVAGGTTREAELGSEADEPVVTITTDPAAPRRAVD